MHLKMISHGLMSCTRYTILKSLTDWLREIDCKTCYLSIMCHIKYTPLFNTPKYPIE